MMLIALLKLFEMYLNKRKIFINNPGFNSVSNRNQYKECFLGRKGGRCVWLTILLPSCAECLAISETQILEPSGPVHACIGIALPFY